MIIFTVLGLVALIAAGVLALTHVTGGAIVLALLGAVLLLSALVRRFGRKGDFSRSGWTGQ